MPAAPDWMAVRGEWISLLLVAALLTLAVRPLSRLLELPRDELGDLFWNGALAFVVIGRLVYVAIESPEALTDPLVLIRIQGGIEPIAGIAAAGAVLGWRTRRLPADRPIWLGAAAAGFAISVIGYDLACIARDACTGAEAPAPFGFAMSGLSETRVATPLLEAALLLVAGGLLLSSSLAAHRGLIALAGVAALVRVVLTPLSVVGTDALGVESVLFALVGVATIAFALRGTSALPQATASEAAIDARRF